VDTGSSITGVPDEAEREAHFGDGGSQESSERDGLTALGQPFPSMPYISTDCTNVHRPQCPDASFVSIDLSDAGIPRTQVRTSKHCPKHHCLC
jgi:hypothetical protein